MLKYPSDIILPWKLSITNLSEEKKKDESSIKNASHWFISVLIDMTLEKKEKRRTKKGAFVV